MLKLNVNSAFYEDMNEIAVGMVLRDDHDMFILTKSSVRPGRVEVDVGEAMGFYEALSWLHAQELENVIIEGNFKIVVDAIASGSSGLTTFYDYIRACQQIINQCSTFTVKFVRRDANKMVHEFARAPRSYRSSFCWLDLPIFMHGLSGTLCVFNNEN